MSPLHNGLTWQEFGYPYLGGDTGIFQVAQPQPTDSPFIQQGGGSEGGFVTDNNSGGGFITDYGGGYTAPDNGLVSTPAPYYGDYVGDNAEIIFG
jgi:hypothetical protein